MRSWCKLVSWFLDLHSYLLGDGSGQQIPEEQRNGEAPPPVQQADGGGLGAAHQAFLLREGPTGNHFMQRSFISCICLFVYLLTHAIYF